MAVLHTAHCDRCRACAPLKATKQSYGYKEWVDYDFPDGWQRIGGKLLCLSCVEAVIAAASVEPVSTREAGYRESAKVEAADVYVLHRLREPDGAGKKLLWSVVTTLVLVTSGLVAWLGLR